MKKQQPEAEAVVESPWAFELGAQVEVNGVAGEVVWRRENAAGDRDYEVKTVDGQAWHAESAVK